MRFSVCQRAFVELLSGCFIWAFVALIRKQTFPGFHPITINATSCLVIALFTAALFRPSREELVSAFRNHFLIFFIMAFAGCVGAMTLSYVGLQHIPLSAAEVLEQLKPIFILFFARWMIGERIAASCYPLVVLAFVGAMLVAFPQHGSAAGENYQLGVVATILSAILFGLNSVVNKIALLKHISIPAIICWRFLLGAVILSIALPFLDSYGVRSQMEWQHVVYLIGGSILSGIAFVLFYRSLRILPVTRVGMVQLSTPLFAVLLGLTALGETLSLSQWLGIPLLLVSLCFLQRNS